MAVCWLEQPRSSRALLPLSRALQPDEHEHEQRTGHARAEYGAERVAHCARSELLPANYFQPSGRMSDGRKYGMKETARAMPNQPPGTLFTTAMKPVLTWGRS